MQRNIARAIRALALRPLVAEAPGVQGHAAHGPPKAADLYAYLGPALAGAEQGPAATA